MVRGIYTKGSAQQEVRSTWAEMEARIYDPSTNMLD